jgi:hypothetical protein
MRVRGRSFWHRCSCRSLPALKASRARSSSTVLDGKGAILRDIAIVVEGTRIARIDANVWTATSDLRGVT